jgi:hypothetical protein
MLPDGLFIGVLFGGDTLSALRHGLYEAEDEVYGQVSPRISPMIKLQHAAGLLQSGGFTMPVVDRDLVRVNYSALSRLFMDLRDMGETNALTDRSRAPTSRRFFRTLEAIMKRNSGDENGKLVTVFDLICMAGWKAHKDQPKPLKPGSATTKLSDALGVKEQKL